MSAIFTDEIVYSAFTVEREDGTYRLVIDITGFVDPSDAHMFLYQLMGDAYHLEVEGGVH